MSQLRQTWKAHLSSEDPHDVEPDRPGGTERSSAAKSSLRLDVVSDRKLLSRKTSQAAKLQRYVLFNS